MRALLLALVTVSLAGCSAAVISSNRDSITVKPGFGPDLVGAGRLAQEHCERTGRGAVMVAQTGIGPDTVSFVCR